MNIFWTYVIVFLLAATPLFEVVVVIPVAVVAGLHAFPVALLALLGNIATVLLVILMVDKIQSWLQRRKEAKGEPHPSLRQGRAKRIWNRYGLPGLAILGPLIVGSHLTVLMGLSFGGTKKQMTAWILASLTLWTLIVTLASHYGAGLLFENTGKEGFLVDLLGRNE